MPYAPGCGSVSEISNAQAAGCDVTKVFPAGNVGGPSFVKNVLKPFEMEQFNGYRSCLSRSREP